MIAQTAPQFNRKKPNYRHNLTGDACSVTRRLRGFQWEESLPDGRGLRGRGFARCGGDERREQDGGFSRCGATPFLLAEKKRGKETAQGNLFRGGSLGNPSPTTKGAPPPLDSPLLDEGRGCSAAAGRGFIRAAGTTSQALRASSPGRGASSASPPGEGDHWPFHARPVVERSSLRRDGGFGSEKRDPAAISTLGSLREETVARS